MVATHDGSSGNMDNRSCGNMYNKSCGNMYNSSCGNMYNKSCGNMCMYYDSQPLVLEVPKLLPTKHQTQ